MKRVPPRLIEVPGILVAIAERRYPRLGRVTLTYRDHKVVGSAATGIATAVELAVSRINAQLHIPAPRPQTPAVLIRSARVSRVDELPARVDAERVASVGNAHEVALRADTRASHTRKNAHIRVRAADKKRPSLPRTRCGQSALVRMCGRRTL